MMSFRRGLEDVAVRPTSLRLVRVGPAEADAFGRIVAKGYGLPEAAAAWAGGARALGCDLLVTETGERRDDLPSSSYRNLLRAGFTEVSVRANWLRPALISQPL